MQSPRQKQLDIAIMNYDLKLVQKLAKKIMKQSEFNNFTIRSRANKLF